MEPVRPANAVSSGAKPVLNGEVLISAKTAPSMSNGVAHEPRSDANAHIPKDVIQCDCLIVGAGFSGITAIHRFRKLGLKVKCFESGGDFGGVWYWNRYPGARVDTEAPFYQLNIPEVYRRWHFTERFPDHKEIRRYMAHLDKTLDLRKDTFFNARVVDASWDQQTNLWTIKTTAGHVAQAKYLMLSTGLLHRTYIPDFPGLKDYKGEIHHSAAWPEAFSAKGKKIAIIGAGATAVQITQELGKEADELTVFLRRPGYGLPLQQRKWTEEEQHTLKAWYPAMFKAGRESAVGLPTARQNVGVFDVTVEEREALFEDLWRRGGFHIAVANYNNVVVDKDANKVMYDFWRRKVCERLTDPAKQKIMAPKIPPYYFGTKRFPIEQDYYEVLNQANVSIHELSKAPLKSFTETGLHMDDGTKYDFDAVVLATGFDSHSGSLTAMGLKNKDGVELAQLWKESGISNYLGITMAGFPNVFLSFTSHAPSTHSNGPTVIEAQVEAVAAIIAKMEAENGRTIEPQHAAEEAWKREIDTMSKHTLLPYTDSWWNGTNIPGKRGQNMIYLGGVNTYERRLTDAIAGWTGFDVVTG